VLLKIAKFMQQFKIIALATHSPIYKPQPLEISMAWRCWNNWAASW